LEIQQEIVISRG